MNSYLKDVLTILKDREWHYDHVHNCYVCQTCGSNTKEHKTGCLYAGIIRETELRLKKECTS